MYAKEIYYHKRFLIQSSLKRISWKIFLKRIELTKENHINIKKIKE